MSKKQDKQAVESETTEVQSGQRREFLRAATFAAAGFVVTPIFFACGGDEPAPKGKPKDKGGAKAPPAAKPQAQAPAAGGSGPKLVDTAAEVGDRGSVKFTATTKKPVEEKYLTIDAGQTNAAEAGAVNGGKGVYDDAFVAIAGTGGVNYVADVLFAVDIGAGINALKHTKPCKGANWNFRFTRMMHVGRSQAVSYVIGDQVNHNINIKNPGGNDIGEQKNAAATAAGPVTETFAATNFARPGSYEVACSMHTWEKGYVYVSAHNYVGVTGNPHDKYGEGADKNFVQGNLDGTVVINDIPVGKHKVNVIHNGRIHGTIEVEVKKDEQTVATYDFA